MGVRLSVTPRERSASSASVADGESEGAQSDEAVYEFDQDRILIGRGAGADVALPHRSVSTRHATIEQRAGRYVIVDHGTTNGTRINGAKLVPERSKPLRDGDRIDVGVFVLRWKEGVAVAGGATAERTATLARRLLREVLRDRTDGARFVITNGPQAGESLTVPLPPARLVIGRAETCDLVLRDADASREHVDLIVDLDGVIARDRGSKNGLLISDRRFPEKRLLDRDELVIGATVIVFEDLAQAALREAQTGADEPLPEPPPPPVADVRAIDPSPTAAADDPEAPTGEPEPARPSAPSEPSAPSGKRGSSTIEPASSKVAPTRARLGSGELIIYALALMVFLASIAGLVLLLRAD